MEVHWSLPAAEDLERICQRIERDDPEVACRIARTIYDDCARLKDSPRLGRASNRMTGRRELVFSPLPYIVVYQIMDYAIEISRIFHGAPPRGFSVIFLRSHPARVTECVSSCAHGIGPAAPK
jgi:plasmid stabilization system protein ParE